MHWPDSLATVIRVRIDCWCSSLQIVAAVKLEKPESKLTGMAPRPPRHGIQHNKQ
jgi:hypothetical protein